MSFSKERQDYHLTPRGWEEGIFQGDVLGGKKDIDIPADMVLTISCYDEKSYPYSKSMFYDKIIWKSDDKAKMNALIKKFGDKPDWFGYDKVK
ncbi:MAG: hypothetical protein KAQ89_05485 [Planctomycetes bacterium]|nr:hypothetical protein [Planctomycetota bacterium]